MEQDVALIVEQTKEVFNASGYPYARIVSVIPDESKGIWKVKVDVGITVTDIKEVTINDLTGKITEYR